ncbi:unnamed protein product [Vitrella brassicaformis CCMP3155]|uniref:Uncharacterized protein n=1 Tax=Vitrella brassicaformis (strain CCMP3155) TaxID=1169540 RepID=A0A0G4EXI4_VITBC|nr:unnamed protein product [Vitrella brassicaformis CCMP3155]|eukprot:CEM03523.1 unnamed protein product [Vitrella brassicaformis CCMP3155]
MPDAGCVGMLKNCSEIERKGGAEPAGANFLEQTKAMLRAAARLSGDQKISTAVPTTLNEIANNIAGYTAPTAPAEVTHELFTIDGRMDAEKVKTYVRAMLGGPRTIASANRLRKIVDEVEMELDS